MTDHYDLIVVGGGAAGFYCAIQCAELSRNTRIIILEKSREVLSKVRVSGGGRCNVTHACFDPQEMVRNYPRGHKELLGPFHRFLGGDMMHWLAEHGVATKIEDDNRVFPVSDDSETIIRCFLDQCKKHKITVRSSTSLRSVAKIKGHWQVDTITHRLVSSNILLATGSSHASWTLIKNLGHRIIEPVPSLFTFTIVHPLLSGLAGITFTNGSVSIQGTAIVQQGPILITHTGLSGPAILKLSSWGAEYFFKNNYRATIVVNWTDLSPTLAREQIEKLRLTQGFRKVVNTPFTTFPKRFWQRIIEYLKMSTLNYADLNAEQIGRLLQMTTACALQITGKTTNKDEFVTCGGVDTGEVNFTTMESRLLPGLYFAGEVLNIDAVTGGFNFQAAWTEAYIAAKAITSKI